MTTRLVFVIGASGAGKTAVAERLKRRIEWRGRVHSFDTIGVPSADEIAARFGSGEEWQRWATQQWVARLTSSAGPVQLLEAQTRPSFISDALAGTTNMEAVTILLDCSIESRRHRLVELRKQPELASPQMDSWAAYLRGQADALGLTVIDTSDLPINEVADQVQSVALRGLSVGGALAASIASVGAAPALRPLDPDVFENSVLRVRVRKPQGWRYVDMMSWSLIWSATRFESGEMSDEELKDLLGRPLVVMAPGEVDRTDVHPNMSIWPDPDITPDETLEVAHADCIPVLDRIFRGFDLLEEPSPAQLGGAEASRLRLRYVAESHIGVSRQCDVEHYLLKRDQLFVGINFAHASEGHDPSVLDQLRGICESFEFWD